MDHKKLLINNVWRDHGLTHAYDAAGRRTSTTDAVGNKTLFFYDMSGRMTHTVNALGEVSENVYGAMGRLTSSITYAGRIVTTGLTGTNAGGLVNTTLTSAIAAIKDSLKDSAVSYSYNAAGTVVNKVEALSVETGTMNVWYPEWQMYWPTPYQYVATDTTYYQYNAFGEEIQRYSYGSTATHTTTYDLSLIHI